MIYLEIKKKGRGYVAVLSQMVCREDATHYGRYMKYHVEVFSTPVKLSGQNELDIDADIMKLAIDSAKSKKRARRGSRSHI